MLRTLLLVTLACSYALADEAEATNQRKRGILNDGWVGLTNPYGIGQPWTGDINPWRGLKLNAELPLETAGWQYGAQAKPIAGWPIKHETHHVKTVPVVVTKHVVVEKPVAVRVPEPVIVEKPIHVPVEKIIHVPVEKIIHKPVPVAVPYPQAVPVPIEHAVPIPVKHPVAVPIHQPYPVPIRHPIPYPVAIPVPYPVHQGHHHGYHGYGLYNQGLFHGHGHYPYAGLPYHQGYYPSYQGNSLHHGQHGLYGHGGPEHYHSYRSTDAKSKRTKQTNDEEAE